MNTNLLITSERQPSAVLTGGSSLVFTLDCETISMSLDDLGLVQDTWAEQWEDEVETFRLHRTTEEELAALARWRGAMDALHTLLDEAQNPNLRHSTTAEFEAARAACQPYMDLIAAQVVETRNEEEI